MAAELIPGDCAVALNLGTTTEAVATALFGHRNLMVLTNNLNILQMMTRAPGKQLVLVGGSVRNEDGAVVGGAAVPPLPRTSLMRKLGGVRGELPSQPNR